MSDTIPVTGFTPISYASQATVSSGEHRETLESLIDSANAAASRTTGEEQRAFIETVRMAQQNLQAITGSWLPQGMQRLEQYTLS